MNKNLITINIITIFLIVFSLMPIKAAIGCISKDNCFGSSGYEYVSCSCNCARYEHDFDRGACKACGHYRVP